MKLAPIAKYALKETRVRHKHLATTVRHTAKHPDDPEAIHDLRVSIRRFTQCLRTFSQLFDPTNVKRQRHRLRRVMDLCAGVRNCDVALSLLNQVSITGGASVLKLKKTRTEAQEELHQRLKKEHHRHATVRAIRRPPIGNWRLDQSVEVNLNRVLPTLVEDFFEAGEGVDVTGASPTAMHQFRLRAKRFRYTIEIFEPFYGPEMARGLKDMKGLQDRLGDINDCVTTIGLLGTDRRAAAAIQQLLDLRNAEFQRYWRSRFTLRRLAWWKRWLGRPKAA